MRELRLLDTGDGKSRDPGALRNLLRAAGLGGGKGRIRCPRCRWTPGRHDRWACRCGAVWNTFDTGGLCPACNHQWTRTMCLSCHRWSRHLDWYEREGGEGPRS